MLLKYTLITFLIVFGANFAQASAFDFWDRFTNWVSKVKIAPEECESKPVERFNNTSPEEVDKCIEEICGPRSPITSDAVAGLMKKFQESDVAFTVKHQQLLERAVAASAKGEKNWLEALTSEFRFQRPFSRLSLEEKILATENFLSNSSLPIRYQLPLAENIRASELEEKLLPFHERYERATQDVEFQTRRMNATQVREQSAKLAMRLKEEYGKSPIWNELKLRIDWDRNSQQVALAANSDYYDQAANKSLQGLILTEKLLNEKKSWQRDLVDLGNIGKDFPTIVDLANKSLQGFEQSVSAGLRNCARRTALRMLFLPSEKQRPELKKRVDSIKEKISNKFISKLSRHSQGVLNNLLQKEIEITLPPSKESYERAFQAKFQMIAEPNFAVIESDAISTLSYFFGGSEDFSSYFDGVCDPEPLGAGEDKAHGLDKKIKLSEEAFKQDQIEYVPTHEIFHAMDPMHSLVRLSGPSARTLANIKSCLSEMHGKNTYFVSEDFADFGSAYVNADSPQNAWCNMLSKKPEKLRIWYDHHSPDLLRLLHLQVYRKEGIGPICQRLMKKQNPPLVVKKCF